MKVTTIPRPTIRIIMAMDTTCHSGCSPGFFSSLSAIGLPLLFRNSLRQDLIAHLGHLIAGFFLVHRFLHPLHFGEHLPPVASSVLGPQEPREADELSVTGLNDLLTSSRRLLKFVNKIRVRHQVPESG